MELKVDEQYIAIGFLTGKIEFLVPLFDNIFHEHPCQCHQPQTQLIHLLDGDINYKSSN